MQTAKPIQSRHYGLDLLRLVATGMIIAHHFICHGGLSAMFPRLSPSDMLYQTLNIICYCAVNLYGLISGYVGVGQKFRISRLLELWLQVVVTGVVITAAFAIFSDNPPSARQWFSAVLPLSYNSYWYFTAYFGMYVFLPVMRRALESLTRRTYLITLGAAFVLFCILPLFADQDSFRLLYGYHILWLMVLYATGYYFKRFGFDWLGRHAPGIYIGTMALAIASRVLLETLDLNGIRIILPIVVLEKYTSPTLYLGSLALLALFTRIQLTGRPARIVAALSPMAFGVYLIHVQPLVYDRLIYLCFVPFGGLSAPALLALFIGVCAAVYVLCLLLDWLRIQLFRLLRVRPALNRVEARLRRWLDRILPEEG